VDCPSCGAHNILGAEHCVNCGSDLSNIIPTTPSPDFMREQLSALETQAPPRVGQTDPVSLAVSHMQRHDTDCVLVFDGPDLVGIITSFDILHKVAGPKEDLNAVTCGQIMTKDPVTLPADDEITVAINKMATGEFRHLPIVDGAGPTQLVTVRDVFRHISPHLT
jgi:CBS domain-containing protein